MNGLLIHTCIVSTRKRVQTLPFTGGSFAFVYGDTVTGATSHATGRVLTVTLLSGSWSLGTAVGNLTIDTLVGTFGSSEVISAVSGAHAHTSAANSDYLNGYGKTEDYWTSGSAVRCLFSPRSRMFGWSSSFRRQQTGENTAANPYVVFEPGVVATDDGATRITTTATGYSGTYDVLSAQPVCYCGAGSIDHYEASLSKVSL